MMHIEFFGAAQEVTGSCLLLKAGRSKVLLDCGLIQGSAKDEARNRSEFPFDPGHIDAVVLSHAHLDHSGRLPLLIKSGFNGKVITHRATRDLCRIMLKDAGFLNEKDAQWENRKRQRKHKPLVEPLYTVADADAAMRYFKGIDYGVRQRVAPGVDIRLQDAGHILGSSIVEVWLTEGELTRKLVFSGDLGQTGAPILRDPTRVDEADLVIMESTYGGRCHRSWSETWKELKGVIGEAESQRGNILIPAFAVGRTQELLYIFGEHYQDWGIRDWSLFLDSPMAIRATEVYAKHGDLYDREARRARRRNGNPFHLPNLHISRTANQSMAINRIHSGAMIIAGSGMCTGGRIKHHLKHNLWKEHTHLIMVGFQARGTLGRALVDGTNEVSLWGERIRVAAQVHTIGGLSAHADQAGLLDWYGHFKGHPPLALVHGEPEAQASLREAISQRYKLVAEIPGRGHRINLR